jgi:hypothetical protein
VEYVATAGVAHAERESPLGWAINSPQTLLSGIGEPQALARTASR